MSSAPTGQAWSRVHRAATRPCGSSRATGCRQPRAAPRLTPAKYIYTDFQSRSEGTTLCICTVHLHAFSPRFWTCFFITHVECNLHFVWNYGSGRANNFADVDGGIFQIIKRGVTKQHSSNIQGVRKTLVWASVGRELCLQQQGGLLPTARGTGFFEGLGSGTSRTVVLGRGIVALVDLMYSVDTYWKMFHEGNMEAKCQTGLFILFICNWVKP